MGAPRGWREGGTAADRTGSSEITTGRHDRGGLRSCPGIEERTARMNERTYQLLTRRASRRSVLGAAAVAPALGLAGGGGRVTAQEKPTLTMWFDSTGGPEIAQCLVDGVIEPYGGTGTAVIEATL